MNIFLFGIGGTGARVLRSLTYCLASNMGDFAPGITFVPMIIDHDNLNKDKDIAIDTMEEYRTISDAIHGQMNASSHDNSYRNFFLPRMKYLSEIQQGNANIRANFPASFQFQFGIGNNNSQGTFSNYIDLNALGGDLSITSDLLKALYNDEQSYFNDAAGNRIDNPVAELNLDLGKGYRGNPNIGTVVFDSITDTPAYDYFTKNFLPGQDAIVIIGSIFGGTGSSGIPKLIEAIRTNPATGWSTAKVAAIMVMPYFKVDTPQNTPNNVTPAIQDEIFKSKQKAALTFYDSCTINGQSMNDNFDAIYYVAEEDSRQHRNRYSEGGTDQQNLANIVDLIAAMGVIDFVDKIQRGTRLNKFNEYGLEADSTDNQKLILTNFINADLNGPLKRLTALALALKHYRDHIYAGKPNNKASYYGDNGLKIPQNINKGIYKNLKTFSDYFATWLDEMEKVNHSFAPYDFAPSTPLNKVVEGFVSKEGNWVHHKGVSYSDFDSLASTVWVNKASKLQNKDEAFMKVLFDAATKEADFATQKRK
ncbi:MAG: hypothetical protein J1F38_00650 [Muribaculaceae bacterium]|nr:hypothetical protein [Muribaculaceae bacterium]